MQLARLTIVLKQEEMEALRSDATRSFRNPKQQARYLLRQALGLSEQSVDAGEQLELIRSASMAELKDGHRI
jgi:hypothetical protein